MNNKFESYEKMDERLEELKQDHKDKVNALLEDVLTEAKALLKEYLETKDNATADKVEALRLLAVDVAQQEYNTSYGSMKFNRMFDEVMEGDSDEK